MPLIRLKCPCEGLGVTTRPNNYVRYLPRLPENGVGLLAHPEATGPPTAVLDSLAHIGEHTG